MAMNSGDWHIFPTDDLIEHEVDGDACVCGPRNESVKREDGSIFWLQVHHSLDGRENKPADLSTKVKWV